MKENYQLPHILSYDIRRSIIFSESPCIKQAKKPFQFCTSSTCFILKTGHNDIQWYITLCISHCSSVAGLSECSWVETIFVSLLKIHDTEAQGYSVSNSKTLTKTSLSYKQYQWSVICYFALDPCMMYKADVTLRIFSTSQINHWQHQFQIISMTQSRVQFPLMQQALEITRRLTDEAASICNAGPSFSLPHLCNP